MTLFKGMEIEDPSEFTVINLDRHRKETAINKKVLLHTHTHTHMYMQMHEHTHMDTYRIT